LESQPLERQLAEDAEIRVADALKRELTGGAEALSYGVLSPPRAAPGSSG
jgi:hypothetical protein